MVGEDLLPAPFSMLALLLGDPDQAGDRSIVDLDRRPLVRTGGVSERDRGQSGGVSEPVDRLIGRARLPGQARAIRKFREGERTVSVGSFAQAFFQSSRRSGRVSLRKVL